MGALRSAILQSDIAAFPPPEGPGLVTETWWVR